MALKHWLRRFPTKPLALMIEGVAQTIQYEVLDPAGVTTAPPQSPLIFAFWHNRFFLLPFFYRRLLPGRQLAVLVSESNDGQFLSRLLTHFSVAAVRGSTSKRGSQGFRHLVRLARVKQWDLAIAPDGPRGPRYTIQKGVFQLSQLTGLLIVPVTYTLSRRVELPSWDRFQVPLPFSCCALRLGTPFRVPHNAKEKDIQEFHDRLARELGR